MNKQDLITKVATDHSLTKKVAGEIVANIFETVMTAVAAGDKVSLAGFLTLEKVAVAEKQGRNPQTGAALTIPSSSKVRVRIPAAFKALVKGE
jgi:DNA-binding protein HU-beta